MREIAFIRAGDTARGLSKQALVASAKGDENAPALFENARVASRRYEIMKEKRKKQRAKKKAVLADDSETESEIISSAHATSGVRIRPEPSQSQTLESRDRSSNEEPSGTVDLTAEEDVLPESDIKLEKKAKQEKTWNQEKVVKQEKSNGVIEISDDEDTKIPDPSHLKSTEIELEMEKAELQEARLEVREKKVDLKLRLLRMKKTA